MWRLSNILFVASVCFFSCASPEVEKVGTLPVDYSEIVDSIAIGHTRFGTDRSVFIASLDVVPVQNKMTEPQFNELVNELEVSVVVSGFTYSGHYYFDRKDRLYKIHLQYQNEKRLVKGDYNEAYENLYEYFEKKYGPGVFLNTMPGLKSVTWNLKNKKIELTGSCLASNCSMECSIIETNLFAENTIHDRINGARLRLELKSHPENF